MWSTAQRQKKYTDLMFMMGLMKTRKIDYGKKCSLVWSCVEERGWLHLERGIRFSGWWLKEESEAEEDMEKAG